MTQNTNSGTISWKSLRDSVLANPEVIALRSESGLTQRELAERVGIKQPQLARIESGRSICGLCRWALLHLLGLHPSGLLHSSWPPSCLLHSG